MIAIALILIALNVFVGELSWTGRRLHMSTHPVMVRLRFFAFGLVVALFLTDYDWRPSGALGWLAVGLLAVSVARFHRPEKGRI
jgi:hypothetical protein